MPITLFNFAAADEASWDGVMGGRSAGYVAVSEGTLRFTGTLVTQGRGFTLVRARRVVDLTGQIGLERRVRGSGRPFEVEVDDGLRTYGRNVSRRAPFPSSMECTLIRVPFNKLRSTIFGQAVNAPPIDLAGIRGVGRFEQCPTQRHATPRAPRRDVELPHLGLPLQTGSFKETVALQYEALRERCRVVRERRRGAHDQPRRR